MKLAWICVTMWTLSLVMGQNNTKTEDEEWKEYKLTFNIRPLFRTAGEEKKMRNNWRSAKTVIKDNKMLYAKKKVSYIYDFNKFCIYSTEEFKKKFLTLKMRNWRYLTSQGDESYYSSTCDYPTNFDWRRKGVITPVKDQGECGACYAFSSVDAIAAQYNIISGKNSTLSVQKVLDCSKTEGNTGCTGGLVSNVFKYVRNHGLCTEEVYPYKQEVGKCNDKVENVVYVESYSFVSTSCEQLKCALLQGPLVVALDAGPWQYYSKDVFKYQNCSKAANHGVVLVGYNGDQWMVRNSWGAEWGEDGYIRMNLGKNCECIKMALQVTVSS